MTTTSDTDLQSRYDKLLRVAQDAAFALDDRAEDGALGLTCDETWKLAELVGLVLGETYKNRLMEAHWLEDDGLLDCGHLFWAASANGGKIETGSALDALTDAEIAEINEYAAGRDGHAFAAAVLALGAA